MSVAENEVSAQEPLLAVSSGEGVRCNARIMSRQVVLVRLPNVRLSCEPRKQAERTKDALRRAGVRQIQARVSLRLSSRGSLPRKASSSPEWEAGSHRASSTHEIEVTRERAANSRGMRTAEEAIKVGPLRVARTAPVGHDGPTSGCGWPGTRMGLLSTCFLMWNFGCWGGWGSYHAWATPSRPHEISSCRPGWLPATSAGFLPTGPPTRSPRDQYTRTS